ncbi:hypothetical protein Cni_G17740 [Canna indica]|uniref:RRM domain-containing protein n=1 Tax=Canna indica TaxID=4628 RepID=A0AAQ3KMY6_9LILI|nr:hypothetical protein Cni_G17740 [Canna indica]
MAAAEQPPKKRKLYEAIPEPPDPLPHQNAFPSAPPPPPSQEEIIRKRRNKEEIRNLVECYRRIKFCASQKDARLMSELEQAYLSLITASRGCTSVQRVVAELIPRYASFCPTALEAAAKVSINMYSWSLAIIMRGEDVDSVAYETAKACIFGLVDICCTASREAPTSSVIQGICSAVFSNTLTFFVSTFESRDIHKIVSRHVAKLQDPMGFLHQLKHEMEDGSEPVEDRLFMLRAVSLLCIFFAFPKNLLAASFELLVSCGTDVALHRGGQYFLKQVTSHLNGDANEISHVLNRTTDGPSLCPNSTGTSIISDAKDRTDCTIIDHTVPRKTFVHSKNCLLGMAIKNDPSLRVWMLSYYRKLFKSHGPQATTELLSILEDVFGSLSKLVDGEDFEESDTDRSVVSKDLLPGVLDASLAEVRKSEDHSTKKVVSQYVKSFHPLLSHEINAPQQEGSAIHGGERLVTMRNSGNSENICLEKTSGSRVLKRNQSFVSSGKESDIRNDDSAGSYGAVTGGTTTTFSSPKEHSPAESNTSTQLLWYSDGDPRALDVIPASKLLWVNFLGRDATESLVRLRFEDFGILENFMYFPAKDLALIEYRNILDAVKARECLQGSSCWGGCLHIKFLDRGLGSREAVNGVPVGDSCFVYIGNVSNHWLKDELLHELLKAGLRHPPNATSLTSENALLMEFSTAEEAATAIGHIRHYRGAGGCQAYPSRASKPIAYVKGNNFSGCKLLVKQVDASVPDMELINAFSRFGEITGWNFDRSNRYCCVDFRLHEAAELAKSHLHGARFGPTVVEVEIMGGHAVSGPNNVLFSPRPPISHGGSANCKAQTSQLSSLVSSLCVKYNLNRNLSYEINKHNNYEVPASTLYITLPIITSTPFEDEDLRALCNVAVGNVGSVVRLTRLGMQNFSWFVDFNSVDAAAVALDKLRSCPDIFLLAEFRNNRGAVYHEESPRSRKINAVGYSPSPGEFVPTGLESKPGNPYARSFANKPDIGVHLPVSPRVQVENLGMQVQHGQTFQSSWSITSSGEMREMPMDLSFPGRPTNTGDRNWHYMKQENEPQMFAKGGLPIRPNIARSGSVIPPPVPTSLVRPVYLTPSNSWDSSVPRPLLSRTSTGMMINDNRNINACAPVPFIPSSITPLSQLPAGTMQRLDHIVAVPPLPNVAPPPPPSEVPSPLPSSPPPLPLSQPPSVPPPPSSPPPQQQSIDSNLQASAPCSYHRWQGTLSKSGVNYCTIYAIREDSVACKYSNTLSEPADWPARLDVTKRTDIQHVKSTFANTPPHKREVCRLLPSTSSDQKGIQDFISYLKQRDCAGVIKIPAGKSMWGRLLFILSHSPEICSLLAITPNTAECLIALVLPKETNTE